MKTIPEYEKFLSEELKKSNLKLLLLTEDVMRARLVEIMDFVNTIRKEGHAKFGWEPEAREYFLNPMDRKFSYSFLIEDGNKKILMLSFFSVYGDIIHSHCTYTASGYRSLGLAKLLVIGNCLLGIKDGFKKWGGWFPKNNNGSLILFLRLGVKIESMRDNTHLYASGDLKEMVDRAYEIYMKENYSASGK